jgi:hypothetical protein
VVLSGFYTGAASFKRAREHRRYWAATRQTGKIEIVSVDSIGFVENGGRMRLTFTPPPPATDARVDGINLSDVAFAAVVGRTIHSGVQGKFGE